MDIHIDMEAIYNFLRSNDFVVVVFVLAIILLVCGFIFRTFLKAAIVTVVIIALATIGFKLMPQSVSDYFGFTDNTADNFDKVINAGKDYLDNKFGNTSNPEAPDTTQNLGTITD